MSVLAYYTALIIMQQTDRLSFIPASCTHSPVEAEDVWVGFLSAVECKQLHYNRVETKTNLGRKETMIR